MSRINNATKVTLIICGIEIALLEFASPILFASFNIFWYQNDITHLIFVNAEKDSLKKMIRDLEARITNLTGENEDSNVLNKMEVETIQKKINEVEKYNQELKNEILKMTQEVN